MSSETRRRLPTLPRECPACGHEAKATRRMGPVDRLLRNRPSCPALVDETGWGTDECACSDTFHVIDT